MSMQQSVQVAAAGSFKETTIPTEFIQPVTEQPGITTFHGPVQEIPIIDLGERDMDKVVKAVEEASMEWGIFQVVNHGIPVELIQRLQSVGRELFELPLEEKKDKYASSTDGVDGYGVKLQSGNKNKKIIKGWVDQLFHNIWPPSRTNYQCWPQNPSSSYREVNEEYAKYIRQVADKVFGILSLGLGLPENAIKEAIGGEELLYLLKINYYPPCPRPDLALGVGAHTDFSALTILVSNQVTGLQVLKDDQWIEAKYNLNALIVNIGNQIEILSNGKYKSVLHRSTVEKERTRMSWPVFLDPPVDLVIGPFPQLINDDNPSKYKAKKFKDYIYCNLNKIPK